MSTDLHAQLVAAVRARLEVARAYRGGHGWCGDDEYEELQQTGDPDSVGPDSVVRHCERDLRVLERHAPAAQELASSHTWCDHCDYTSWPCAEIRDLAVAYGLDPTAGE